MVYKGVQFFELDFCRNRFLKEFIVEINFVKGTHLTLFKFELTCFGSRAVLWFPWILIKATG